MELERMSALELARAIAKEGDELARLARPHIAPVPEPISCGCCGDPHPEDELVSDNLNGKICQECAEAFADLHVPEWDCLDKD